MSEIYYDVDGNIVKARFTKPWVDKFSAELLKLGICVSLKLKVSLYHMNYVECGKAKCHPDDRFSKQLGEEIARDRLLEKYYYDVARIQDDIKKYLENKIEAGLRKGCN